MMRLFLLLILATSVLLGLPGRVTAALEGEVASVEVTHVDNCCPDTDSGSPGDCCDVDFGRCCTGSISVLPTPSPALVAVTVSMTELLMVMPAHLLHPRTTGPPPTPPPIA